MSTRVELPRIARLAGLHFTDAELDRLASELDDVLERIAGLDRVVVSDAAPFEAGTVNVDLRADVPGPDELAVPASYIAPEWRDGFFTVPRLPTHSGE